MRLINADRIEYKGKCMTPTGIVERSYIENMPAVDLLLSEQRAKYIKKEINALTPEPIDYQMCADAMMKMWIEKIITDAEYNKIMDRLNEWEERNK